MYNSPHGFSVAGMPTPSSSSSTFGTSTLGSSTSGGGSSNALSASSAVGVGVGGGPASSYKSGYLLSASSSSPDAFFFESSAAPPGESAVRRGVLSFSRGVGGGGVGGGGGGGGLGGGDMMEDSMFGRGPQGVEDDEDGPPRESVVDIPGMRTLPSSSSSTTTKSSAFRSSSGAGGGGGGGEFTYVVVYGFPADAYAQAVSFFKSIAEHPEDDVVVERSAALRNAVRIGYRDPADAHRALRRDGSTVAADWIVGVKSAGTGTGAGTATHDPHAIQLDSSPSIGTPIKLLSQRSVFKTAGPPTPTPADPVPAPSKGVVGQMTDLIFGW